MTILDRNSIFYCMYVLLYSIIQLFDLIAYRQEAISFKISIQIIQGADGRLKHDNLGYGLPYFISKHFFFV